MEPCIALKTAIRSRLIAAPALIDLVPANAIFDRHTRPELDRMIVVGTGNTLYADEYDTFADQAFLDLHIWCRDESFTTCQNVAHLIRETLRHAPWRAGEYVVHGISVTSRFLNDPDAAFRHGVVSVSTTIGTNLKGALVGVVAVMRDFADMLNKTEEQSASTIRRRIETLRAAAENMRKSSLAYTIGGGADGIARREAEADQLQAQLDSRVPLPPPRGNPPPPPPPKSKGKTEAEKLADSYRDLIANAERRVADLNTETAVVGMATREAERFRMEQELIAEAQRAGIPLTDAQRQAIASLASSYGDAAASAEAAAQRLDNATGAKQFFADTGMEAVKGFVTDLKDGLSATDALSSALGRLGDRLLDLGLDLALQPLLNSLSGGLASVFGFSQGGAVRAFASGGQVRGPGTGTSDSIPARLSNGEYVVNARATERHRALLDAINSGRSLPGFAAGGAIGKPGFVRAGGARQTISVTVAPSITVEGGSQGAVADEALAKRIGAQVEEVTRAVVQDELIRQMRPGNLLG